MKKPKMQPSKIIFSFATAFILGYGATANGQVTQEQTVPFSEASGVSVDLPGKFVKSPITTASISGPSTGEIVAMTIVVHKEQNRSQRLRPADLKKVNDKDWFGFQPNVQIDLGKGDGQRALWFGFRMKSGKVSWQRSTIALDTTPPEAVITAPKQGRVSEPVIQLQGFSREALLSVKYDIKNSSGTLRDVEAAISDRVFDPEIGRIGLTKFQCYDLKLADGINQVTLKLIDFAGNASQQEVSFTLDISSDGTPPLLDVHWPKMLDEINSRKFRVRGQISEPNSRIEVVGLSEKPVSGLVERDGFFWIPNLPLKPGVNTFSVVATDPAGNSSTEVLTVIKSDVEVTIDEPSDEEKAKKQVRITGSVNQNGYTVWVNGVKAQMDGLRWQADNVPINDETGTAVIQAVPIPNSINNGNGYGTRKKPRLEDLGNPKRQASPDK